MSWGRRNKDVTNPTQEDCEPGCQDCYWVDTCDGPPDLCLRCGLAIPYSGFITDDASMCTCHVPVRREPQR